MRAKYVMTDKGPILFGPAYKHSDFAHLKPTSAGFVNLDGGPTTYGESMSLNMAPGEDDAAIIESCFTSPHV